MQHKELTAQLRRMSVETGSLMCLGCGYEHNCGIHGCALLRQAVETIEKQAAADNFYEEETEKLNHCPIYGRRSSEKS